MGQEFAMDREWHVREELDWDQAERSANRDVTQCLSRLIKIYKTYPCLYADSRDPASFEWVNRNDAGSSVISFIRRNPQNYDGAVLAVISFSPMEYPNYRIGVPVGGVCKMVFSTYESPFSEENSEKPEMPLLFETENQACDGHPYRIALHLRPFESLIMELPYAETGIIDGDLDEKS